MSKIFDEELAEIEATAVAYLKAFTNADIAAVMATYSDDGVLMGPGMSAAVGKDELASAYRNALATIGFDMNYEIKEVEQISPDWAFVRSATEGTETNKATGVVTPATYHELFLLRKSPTGSWQISRYCTSKIS